MAEIQNLSDQLELLMSFGSFTLKEVTHSVVVTTVLVVWGLRLGEFRMKTPIKVVFVQI